MFELCLQCLRMHTTRYMRASFGKGRRQWKGGGEGGRDWEHYAQLSYIRVRGLALHTQVLRANAVAMSFCARVCARCLSTLDYRSS